ncbi:MAG: hypothetical protein QOC76_6011 [Mycobacterium sp.]|jgi:hypothetical protein|nr:hypothetical protein [Mycobacterium sp.]
MPVISPLTATVRVCATPRRVISANAHARRTWTLNTTVPIHTVTRHVASVTAQSPNHGFFAHAHLGASVRKGLKFVGVSCADAHARGEGRAA